MWFARTGVNCSAVILHSHSLISIVRLKSAHSSDFSRSLLAFFCLISTKTKKNGCKSFTSAFVSLNNLNDAARSPCNSRISFVSYWNAQLDDIFLPHSLYKCSWMRVKLKQEKIKRNISGWWGWGCTFRNYTSHRSAQLLELVKVFKWKPFTFKRNEAIILSKNARKKSYFPHDLQIGRSHY